MMRSVTDLVEDFRRHHQEPRIVSITEEVIPISGATRYTVMLDDGTHASTIKESLADECYRMKDLGVPVSMERIRKENDWGRYILTSIKPLVKA